MRYLSFFVFRWYNLHPTIYLFTKFHDNGNIKVNTGSKVCVKTLKAYSKFNITTEMNFN